MANILITHFSGIIFNGEYQTSCFYEGLIQGLRESGHHCLEMLTSDFLPSPWSGNNKPFNKDIQCQILNAAKAFNPDLVISFNNSSIEGLEKVLNCPIALWGADSFQFFNDKDSLKENADRYFYMGFSQACIKDYLKHLKVSPNRVCRVPSATAICTKPEEKKYNISFIGTPFFNHPALTQLFIQHPECMDLSRDEIEADKPYFENIMKPYGFPLSMLIHYQSGEKRAKLIANLLEQGIHVFGPSEWLQLAQHDSKMIHAYDPRLAYTLKHNELIYNRSKISLNISHTQTITGYAWRVLDILASSSVLLTDDKSDLRKDFSHLVDLQFYHTPHDAYKISQRLLQDEKMREAIIQQQNTAIEHSFRWKHRFPLIEQLTGVNLTAQPNAIKGRYTLFRVEKSNIQQIFYHTAVYFLKRSPKKRRKMTFSLKRILKKLSIQLLKRFMPGSIRWTLLRARLANLQTVNNEYQ